MRIVQPEGDTGRSGSSRSRPCSSRDSPALPWPAFRGAEGGRQLAHLAEVIAVGLGEAQQDAPGHAMREVVGYDIAYGFAQLATM